MNMLLAMGMIYKQKTLLTCRIWGKIRKGGDDLSCLYVFQIPDEETADA
jgi:hypothetical protein